MAIHQIILPKLGTNIEEGIIIEWKKSEGEPLKKGEVLLVVETSKAIFDVESEHEGVLRRIISRGGETVSFTQPVGILTERADEDITGFGKKPAHGHKRHHERKREELFKPAQKSVIAELTRVRATPAARRLSDELQVDLEELARSAGAGVVEAEDVRRFSERKKVAIYGAGLGAKQAKELLRFQDNVNVVGVFDDNPNVKGREVLGFNILGGWDEFLESVASGTVNGVVISLHSEFRRKLIQRIVQEAPGAELVPLVDPRAIVSGGCVISKGTFIEAGSVIGPDTFIGDGAIIDVGATVSHDCHIGAHSHLSPGCSISGIVRLEENVLVGVGASINSQVTIGKNVVITPGAAVMSDFPDDVVIGGNPAKVMGRSFRGM